MADLDDLNNPGDQTPVPAKGSGAYLTPFAPKVEHLPGDVWHWLDEDLRAEFEAEYWPALRADEQAAQVGQPPVAVRTVTESWWPRAQICACPGARAQVERCEREIAAGTIRTVPYDHNGDD